MIHFEVIVNIKSRMFLENLLNHFILKFMKLFSINIRKLKMFGVFCSIEFLFNIELKNNWCQVTYIFWEEDVECRGQQHFSVVRPLRLFTLLRLFSYPLSTWLGVCLIFPVQGHHTIQWFIVSLSHITHRFSLNFVTCLHFCCLSSFQKFLIPSFSLYYIIV